MLEWTAAKHKIEKMAAGGRVIVNSIVQLHQYPHNDPDNGDVKNLPKLMCK